MLRLCEWGIGGVVLLLGDLCAVADRVVRRVVITGRGWGTTARLKAIVGVGGALFLIDGVRRGRRVACEITRVSGTRNGVGR